MPVWLPAVLPFILTALAGAIAYAAAHFTRRPQPATPERAADPLAKAFTTGHPVHETFLAAGGGLRWRPTDVRPMTADDIEKANLPPGRVR